jgi:hypothetical protein
MVQSTDTNTFPVQQLDTITAAPTDRKAAISLRERNGVFYVVRRTTQDESSLMREWSGVSRELM